MPALMDPMTESAKIVLLGDSGHGKTGAKAAAIAIGLKYRGVDTDRGFKVLRSLLTDSHYPYAEYMKKAGIDPTEPGRISYIPIDVAMGMMPQKSKANTGTMFNMLQPTSSAPFERVLDLLNNWNDGDIKLGSIRDWDNDCILDIDTVSTLAELAKYWNQDMNGHLGSLEDDHGRDTGAAQELVSRLNIMLTSPNIRCNVIATTHISWIDTTRGATQSPSQLLRDHMPVDARGFPSIIGRALSPVFGKRWNDMFIVRRVGNRGERRIYTGPIDGIDAKNSVWLDPRGYDLSTGLAEIFNALLYKPPPVDLINHVNKHYNRATDPDQSPGSVGGNQKPTFGSFGTFGGSRN